MLPAAPVVEFKYAEVWAVGDGLYYASGVEVHFYLPYYNYEHCHETYCLQHVSPNDAPYAAAVGVEPYQKYAGCNGNGKRYVPLVEHVGLYYKYHQIELCSRTEHLGQQEERCSRLVAFAPHTAVEVFVYGGQVELVIEREQYFGNDNVSEEESEHHLHICHVCALHPAGNGYERNA